MATSTQIAKGGLAARGSVTVFHTGEAPPSTTTTGTDTTPAVTETYIARVFLPVNAALTGVALLNGSAVAGNVTVALLNNEGVPVAQSGSTAQAGIAGYQLVPFTATHNARGPGLHFIAIQFDSTSARFRSHVLGAFTAFKQTGQTYGTFTTASSPNTFTTGQGPIASTY